MYRNYPHLKNIEKEGTKELVFCNDVGLKEGWMMTVFVYVLQPTVL